MIHTPPPLLSNKVKNFHAMELKGLQSALQKMQERVSITRLITDCHVSMKKHMQNQEPGISHHFDIWHTAKGQRFLYKSRQFTPSF